MGVVLHTEHLIKRYAFACCECVYQHAVIGSPLGNMLYRGAGTFVCPAGQGAIKMCGENGVGDFMWQNRVHHSLSISPDRHHKVEWAI